MMRLSPFLLAALLFALGLSGCSKNHDEPAKAPQQPIQQNPAALAPAFFNNADSSPLLSLIDESQTSLDIAIYEMSDADVLAALRRALVRGVKIRVIKEPSPLGSKCDLFASVVENATDSCVAQRALKEEILAAGGAYTPFQKDTLCADASKPCFLHGKMVIMDSKAVLVSTGNFNSSNLCNLSQSPERCNRDYSMVSRDSELTAFLSTVFARDLQGLKYDLAALLTPSIRSKVTVSPFSLEPLVSLIHSANRSIRIENQYLKDKDMNAALLAAAKRGVRVEVTLASLCAFGPPGQGSLNDLKALFGSFDEAGIDTRMLPAQFQINGRPGYLHAKALVIDDTNAWVGSVNGSWSALSNNREFGLIFSDPTAVGGLIKVLGSDHASPDTETWAESLECKKDILAP